jgi:hypothetical protein
MKENENKVAEATISQFNNFFANTESIQVIDGEHLGEFQDLYEMYEIKKDEIRIVINKDHIIYKDLVCTLSHDQKTKFFSWIIYPEAVFLLGKSHLSNNNNDYTELKEYFIIRKAIIMHLESMLK